MDSPLELRQEHGDDLTPEDLIDPQLFLEWQRSLDHPDRATGAAQSFTAELTGTTGERGMYRVIPIVSGGTINWLDAAGYILARSPKGELHSMVAACTGTILSSIRIQKCHRYFPCRRSAPCLALARRIACWYVVV